MGTKKGQRRKTARKAYLTKKGKSLIKQTEKRKKKFSKKNLTKGRKVGGIFGNTIDFGYIWE